MFHGPWSSSSAPDSSGGTRRARGTAPQSKHLPRGGYSNLNSNAVKAEVQFLRGTRHTWLPSGRQSQSISVIAEVLLAVLGQEQWRNWAPGMGPDCRGFAPCHMSQ